MNDIDIELTIEINYEKEKFSIRTKNQINLEELIKRSIQKFNIVKEEIKNIYFTYMDDNFNTNKINTIEDIYISAKKETNSDNYVSIIYLEIEKTKENILNEESNNIIKSQNINNYLEEKKELQKNIDKIKNQYENKIKELEELIKNMKKNHFIEINKIKKEKKLENSKFLNEVEKMNQNIENLETKFIQNGIEKIENMIINLFNKEKYNLIETIKTMKKEIILEIKEEFKEEKIKYGNLNDIKTRINNINKDIKGNINKIENIQKDITIIKESINKIKEKNEIRDNQKQSNYKDNNDEYYLNNNTKINNSFNIGNNFVSVPPYMNKLVMNKIYECLNCKNLYTLNECFDPKENRYYNEHSFKLKNFDNIIIGNNNDKINADKNNNIINFFKNFQKDDKNK